MSFGTDDNFMTTHVYLSEEAAIKEYEEQLKEEQKNKNDVLNNDKESTLGKLGSFTPSILGDVTNSLERARKKIDDSQTEQPKPAVTKSKDDSPSVQLEYTEEGDYFSESHNTTGGAMLF